MAVLHIKNLTFSYLIQEPIFENFSYGWEKPGLYFVQGKNGSGKSTLFSLITGNIPLQTRVEGTLQFEDKIVECGSAEHKDYAQRVIRTVPQHFDDVLAPQHTFLENMQLAHCASHPFLQSLPVVGTLLSFYDTFGIPPTIPVGKMSGGQRQMSAIAMSIHESTRFLLLDEPTAAFDDKNTKMVMQFLQQLQQERNLTILMICHDIDLFSYSSYKPLVIDR